MKLEISSQRFERSWKPTGHMIKETETMFVQTYKHKNFTGTFKQVGRGKLLGHNTVILEEIKN